jgi:hypothetical protein
MSKHASADTTRPQHTCMSNSTKCFVAATTPLLLMATSTTDGYLEQTFEPLSQTEGLRPAYFSRNQAERAPGYEPPTDTHTVSFCCSHVLVTNAANAAASASACSTDRVSKSSELVISAGMLSPYLDENVFRRHNHEDRIGVKLGAGPYQRCSRLTIAPLYFCARKVTKPPGEPPMGPSPPARGRSVGREDGSEDAEGGGQLPM